jgi:small subunit ribosomal protein S16
MGRKKRPYYRIVVTDTRAPRDGRYIECLGTYDSMNNPPDVKIEEARASYWLDCGAIPSFTVNSLLRHKGILFKRNLKKRGFDDAKIEEELKKWEVVQIEKRKRKSEVSRVSKKAKAKASQAKDEQPKKAAEPAAAVETPSETPVAGGETAQA